MLLCYNIQVTWTVFCTGCGEELSEEAYFCPKCGIRTGKGKEENVPIPREGMFAEVGEELSEIGDELNKVFSAAVKEIEKAVETARQEIRKATSREPIICSSCGQRNVTSARFCNNCGKELS